MKVKNSIRNLLALLLCVSATSGAVSIVNANSITNDDEKTTLEHGINNGINVVQCTEMKGDKEIMKYYFSYNGMTFKEFTDKGLHFAVSWSEDKKTWTKWQDVKDETYFTYGGFVRLAVVDKPMDKLFSYSEDFTKTSKDVLAMTDIFEYNSGFKYNNAPRVMQVTPSNQIVQKPGFHNVTVKFDQHLKEVGNPKVNITFSNATGLHPTVSNLKFENSTEKTIQGYDRDIAIVTFDLLTDETYGTHLAHYHFDLEGLVGEKSGEKPATFNLTTAFDQNLYCGIDKFEGNLLAEPKNEIKGFDLNNFKFTSTEPNDANIILIKDKDGNTTARKLFMSCENDAKKINTISNISFGINFTDGFDKNADYSAYRYVKQPDGTYKSVRLNTQINDKGLRIFGQNTLA